MLSLFNNGEIPLKRINGMELYRLGSKIDPLFRIKTDDAYGDISSICRDARIELKNLIERSNYSHVLEDSKEPALMLIRALNSITGAQDKDKQIDIAIYHNLQRRLNEFEDKYALDVKKGLMFIAAPKGTHDLRLLLEHGERDFDIALPSVCPEAIPDIQAATRCLVYDEFTASVFHFHRAHEIVIEKYMKHRSLTIPDKPNLSKYISAIKTEKNLPDRLLRLLEGAKECRNPIMHPRIYVESLEDANSLYFIVLKSVGIMAREMVVGKAV